MIADCVVAGKARAGEVRPLEINDEILKKAFENTVKLVDDNTEVVEPEDGPTGDLPDDDLPWDFDDAPTDTELDYYDMLSEMFGH